jgi:hypothetical protein
LQVQCLSSEYQKNLNTKTDIKYSKWGVPPPEFQHPAASDGIEVVYKMTPSFPEKKEIYGLPSTVKKDVLVKYKYIEGAGRSTQ